MKPLCKLSDGIWFYIANNKTMPEEEKQSFKTHLQDCPDCANLYAQLQNWKNDTPEENPYLAQKTLDRISNCDSNYTHSSNLVIRWAFSIAIVVGIVLGVFVQTALNNPSPNNQIVENDYQNRINSYSSEIHYNEMKLEETQQLLTEAR